ncbi:MAG: polyprenyl synthetase family protein [Alcanivoracaceae bacterium]|jgi:farnesyl diphosphate synthase|nr:polyprenyl synthetase family protein [Alcanivoracaceae bacterium]
MTETPAPTAFMQSCRQRVDDQLLACLPGDGEAGAPRLSEAMRYAVTAGGKRIRPILLYGACDLCGGALEQADAAAAAIELLHTYSLVHDDLPAMDDDDLRRGQPTCHRAYDEATAILAGDTLHTLAFEVLARQGKYSDGQRVTLISTLCQAAGAAGMAAGQMQDMQGNGQLLTLPALERMHHLKTGRLITAALHMGAIAADCRDEALIDALIRYGDAIGLAFQIQDDILDVTAETSSLGKPQGSDLKHGKSTFPGLIGLEDSISRAKQLCDNACEALEPWSGAAATLQAMARYIIDRPY